MKLLVGGHLLERTVIANQPLKLALLGTVAAACLAGCSGGGTERTPAIVVSPRGNDSNAGTSSAPFRSLKQALLVAKAGDTVRLENGTYAAENGESWAYATPDAITISGEGADQTVLQAPPIDANDKTIALEAASRLTLENLSLVGFDVGLDVEVPAQVSLSNVVIRDGFTGVRIAASDSQLEVDDTTLSILEGDGAALKLNDTSQRSQISLKRASVTGGVFIAGTDAAVSIDDASIDGNGTNAGVNFSGATLEITGSIVRCAAAPYGIGLHAGLLSLEGTTVEGGNYGLYQLGGSSKLRATRLLDYASIGLYFASGDLDLGTQTEAGNNTIAGLSGSTEAFGIYVDTGTAPVTSSNTSFDGVVPPPGIVQAGAQEIAEPGEYFITPGQSMQFFTVPTP